MTFKKPRHDPRSTIAGMVIKLGVHLAQKLIENKIKARMARKRGEGGSAGSPRSA